MLKYLSATLAIAVGVVLITFYLPIFKVKDILISQQSNCLPENTLSLDLGVSDKNLLTFNTNTQGQNITAKYSCAKSVKVTKQFPNKLKIEVKTKQTIAQIEGSELFLTEEGDITGEPISQNLPKFFLPEKISLMQAGGKFTDPQVLFALNLTSLLLKSDFSPSSVRILEAPDIAVYDAKGIIAIFSQRNSADIQVDSLQSVLAKAKIDATKIAKIDLRFQKPVIEVKK